MALSARAAVLTGPERVELREYPLPNIGYSDGLLRVEACGGCGSDVPAFRTHDPSDAGVILGHEVVGVVERAGDGALARWGVEVGDRIVVERWIPCGHCVDCYSGNYRRCIQSVDGKPLFYGGSPVDLPPALWGGFADYMYLHPQSVVYKASPSMPASRVPLFTPLANAISWIQDVANVGIGDSIVIEGPGPVGLAAVLVAVAAGASPVIVLGLSTDQERLATARRFGAVAINIDDQDPVAAVSDVTDGRLADAVLDVTSGAGGTALQTAISVAGVHGRIVTASAESRSQLTFDARAFSNKDLTLRGVWGRERHAIFAALRMLEDGRLPFDDLVTHDFALDSVDEALRTVARDTNPGALHVCVTP